MQALFCRQSRIKMKFNPISIIKNILRLYSRIFIVHQKGLKDLRSLKINRILIVSLTHLGDMVLLSPFLRNLRMNFPQTQIDILLKEQVSDLLQYCPHINKRIIYNAKWTVSKEGGGFLKTFMLIRQLKKNRYDLAFVTHPHIFNNIITWLARIPFRIGYRDQKDNFLNISFYEEDKIQHAYNYPLDLLRYLDLKIESDHQEIHLGSQETAFAEEFCKNLFLHPASLVIGVHPGAGTRERIWLIERYAHVIKYLINKYNAHIFLFGGKQEIDITQKIKTLLKDQDKISDFSGKTNIGQLCALINRCAIFLANDAGPMHIASALGKPIVALFTATAVTPKYGPEIWGPLSKGSKVVFRTDDKTGRLKDMKDIEVEDVIRALDEVIRLAIDIRE